MSDRTDWDVEDLADKFWEGVVDKDDFVQRLTVAEFRELRAEIEGAAEEHRSASLDGAEPVTAAIICDGCWMDSNRNGRCTNPSCSEYREADR